MKFRYLFIAVVLISTVISYLFSREIYHFYIETYYLTIKKENPESSAKKAWRLYRDKNYSKLKDYLNALMYLFPGNLEIRRIAGLYHIENGNSEEGARLILSTLSENTPDRRSLAKSIEILFQKGLYVDVTGELSRFSIDDDPGLTFINGVSHYKIEKYRDALRFLLNSKKLGNNSFEIYYYLGLVYEKLKRYDDSIKSLLRANELNSVNRDVIGALIRLYQKNGQYLMAERLMRRGGYRK
jgi:tetratricopeptide (TPR) repeat protein